MAQPDGVVRFIRGAAGAGAGEPDAELVARFAASRDELAFRALVSRYGPTVWAVCRKVSRDHHAAEDAFQAAFLVLARKANGLRAGAAVGSWLYAVAYRVAARARAMRRPEPGTHEPADARPDALHELSVREAESALHEEIAALPEKYRAPLVLCCLEGLSRDEAAARLGWPANRVKHSLERGREVLRARLTRRGLALALPLVLNALGQTAGAGPPPAVVETLIGYAAGARPPAAIDSLANGVTRTMWTAQLKWLAAGCGALVLAAGALAAALRHLPAPPVAGAPAARAPAPGAAAPKAKPAEPKKEPPKPAWEVATEYLQLIIDGKPKDAEKLGERKAHAQEIVNAELKRVKLAMILVNDARVMVVTERAKLKRRPNAEPTNEHVTVTLERKDAAAPWRVIENDVADEKKVLRGAGDYLEGKFNDKPDPKKGDEKPKGDKEKETKPIWGVAEEFLRLALAEKTDEALKLAVPGTISAKKVGEIKSPRRILGRNVVSVITETEPAAVLLNDTHTEVFFRYTLFREDNSGVSAYLVLMLTQKNDGLWQVKDIDVRSEAEQIRSRFELYLGGRYDTPPKK